jgi:signal transduction histidine kinase
LQSAPFSAGIRARLAFLLIVASLPASTLLVADAVYRYDQEKANALRELRELADAIAATDGRLLQDTRSRLQELAATPALQELREDRLACEQAMAAALESTPQYAFLGAADLAGDVICPGLPLQEPFNVRGTMWFQRMILQRDFVVGNYALDRATKQPVVHMAYPIFSASGEMIGALHAAVRIAWLKERLAGLWLSEGYAVALVDPSGEVLASHPEPGNPFGGALPAPLVEQAQPPTKALPLEPKRWLVAAAPLGSIPWKGVSVLVGAEEARIWAAVARHVALGVALYLAVLALGVAAAVFGAYRLVVLPVRRLHRATELLAAGHRDMPAEPSDNDRSELAGLARAFRTMANRLEIQQGALRAASAQKSRFLAVASHDLRQPLHAAMMSLEFASRGASPEVLAYIERARTSIRRLGQQLDMLAEIVQRDARGSDIGPRTWRVPVAIVLRRIAETYGTLAREKGLQLRVVTSRLAVATDEAFLVTILDNLVDNAIKYTDRGRILIGCRRTAASCRIEVHDTGRGIPAAKLGQIFDAFYRLDESPGEGLGLGLLIAKETAAVLRHRLTVRSTPGAGSCFAVEIPLWSTASGSPPAAGASA